MARRWRIGVRCAVGGMLLLALVLHPSVAQASGSPGGANVYDGNYTSGYTGVQQTRYNSVPGDFPSGSSCSTFYSPSSAWFQEVNWIYEGSGADGENEALLPFMWVARDADR